VIPDWLIQMVAGVAIAVIGWFLRGLREDVDKIRLDLARNYVTHKQLGALRRDIRAALMMMNNLQIELARHFKFKPVLAAVPASDDEDGESDTE
jgi:hypothetical protein